MRSLFAAFLITACAFAQPAPKVARTHAITIDDFATLATITELAISSDGKQVAYCEARWDKVEDNRRADLWVVATDGKSKPRRLTGLGCFLTVLISSLLVRLPDAGREPPLLRA